MTLDEPQPPPITAEEEIAELKTLPVDDMTKKALLARYFQSEEGSGYTAAERKKAYDELLGRVRNAKTIG